MSDSRLINIIRLLQTEGIGPVTFYQYLHKAGTVEAALELAARKQKLWSREKAELELEKVHKIGAEIIAFDDKRYPQNLRQLNDAPPIIYALGNIELLNYPLAISIVGSRNASIAGRKIASRIAYDLTENDVLVISGMARGVDGSAHKGALYAKNQTGATIAVLGTGVDVIYPAENTDIYHDICRQGLVISELTCGSSAQVSNFPRRNRIISALSAGTLVVEAGIHSGSLITAKSALEQGKDVFAVPGSPLDNRSAGANHLIKEGAILTENAEDILNVLSMTSQYPAVMQKTLELPLDKPKNNVNIQSHNESATPNDEPLSVGSQTALIDLISYEGVDIDELLRLCNLPQAEFFSQILDLEFAGKIERQVGNKVAKIKG